MPNFAAWIEGVDLTQPLSEPVKEELRQALNDFEVIFFKPQKLTTEQHIELGKVFGPISDGSYFDRHADTPEVEVLENNADRPPTIDNWHSDISWKEKAPLGTAIQITVTPPAGGNTCWSSMSKAYEYLSENMKAYLRDLRAVHTWEIGPFREYLASQGEEKLFWALRNFPPVEHDVVKVHPESDRHCLYVNSGFTKRIVGLDKRESQAILQFLFNWVQRPEFMVHHQWEAHGIAIWDNRSTQHYAVADYWPYHRINQRVTFDVPE
ncbi:MAG: taurine catabolism dioxygenase TauD [Alcanivorax sp.]|nr:MAG: taurine catabolism dioxygenase TauD [Alcanivorax sp.]